MLKQNIGADRNVRVDRNYWHWQNSRANKILASTKFSRRQKSRFNKMLVQAQKNLFTVRLGRVHSSLLLSDLADDLLRLPEDVVKIIFSAEFHSVPSFGIGSSVELRMPRNDCFQSRNNGNRLSLFRGIFFGTKFRSQP